MSFSAGVWQDNLEPERYEINVRELQITVFNNKKPKKRILKIVYWHCISWYAGSDIRGATCIPAEDAGNKHNWAILAHLATSQLILPFHINTKMAAPVDVGAMQWTSCTVYSFFSGDTK